MRVLTRTLLALSIPVLVSGCALPIPIAAATYASYASAAADGVSYASSGKSVTDHGVSAIMNADCALWRGVVGDRICIDRGDTVKALGVADSARIVATADSARAGATSAHAGAAADSARTDSIPSTLAFDFGVKRAVAPTPVAQRVDILTPMIPPGAYFVLASFPDLPAAQDLIARQAALAPTVMEADVKGRHYYRVIVGPYKDAETKSARAHLAATGLNDFWMLTISPSGPPPALPRRGDIAAAPLLQPSGT